MPAALSEPLTRSVEDYLKGIYRLTRNGGAAGTTELAQLLVLAPPSVSGMVKRLAEQGLVRHTPYRGVELTRSGRRIALRMVRRHRLVETYLVEFLGYDWDDVHEEAERLEHAVSDRLIERMAEALGNPRVDPHGDPIPTAAGEVDELVFPPLTEFAAGSRVRIRRVLASDPEHLRYLAGHGLKPGVAVLVEDRQPFRGPLTLRVSGKRRVIGHEMALRLLCSAESAGDA